MESLQQQIIKIKKRVDELFCELAISTGEGGGTSVETDPTVSNAIKSLTDSDVENVKNMNARYILIDGYTQADHKYVKKNLYFSNTNFWEGDLIPSTYLGTIGEEGFSLKYGIKNNIDDQSSLSFSRTGGFQFDQTGQNTSRVISNRISSNKSAVSMRYTNDGYAQDQYRKESFVSVTSEGIIELKANSIANSNNRISTTMVQILPESEISLICYNATSQESKYFYFRSSGIVTNNLINAIGDTSFTRNVVAKEDGTLGFDTKPDLGIARASFKRYSTAITHIIDNNTANVVTATGNGVQLQVGALNFGSTFNNGTYFICILKDLSTNPVSLINEPGKVIKVTRKSGINDFVGYPYSDAAVDLPVNTRYLVTYQSEGTTVPIIHLIEI